MTISFSMAAFSTICLRTPTNEKHLPYSGKTDYLLCYTTKKGNILRYKGKKWLSIILCFFLGGGFLSKWVFRKISE